MRFSAKNDLIGGVSSRLGSASFEFRGWAVPPTTWLQINSRENNVTPKLLARFIGTLSEVQISSWCR
ncbi:hypothetical protein VDG1235_4622 [Verrucomicrobiia bacterium DG1235]|nr:hypothetical protein VDG1235_4622 [Verrucomicrobiae bacterium DG1235]